MKRETAVAAGNHAQPGSTLDAVAAVTYFLVYLGYLFLHRENELLHWLTLVALPFFLVCAIRKVRAGDASLRACLASVGLRRDNLRSGLLWAVALGLGLSALQIGVSRYRADVLELLSSPRALLILPLTFVMMAMTAGFTEEFFFRGVLQTRLTRGLRSRVAGVVAAALLFGVYHLPYAYLNPRWPSYGDWSAAWVAALAQGGILGLVIGAVYVKSDNNLLAAVVLHASINTLPAAAQFFG